MGGGEARNGWAAVVVDKSIDKDARACLAVLQTA